MQGRLNIFQKTMLQWNDLHPYNAVHVVRVQETLDFERLKGVISSTLQRKGLTGLTLNRSNGTFQFRGGAASAEIELLGPDATSRNLADEVERQLNTGFMPGEPFSPFRFFVAPARDSFSVGLVYFHPMADAECILMLAKEIVDAYRNKANPSSTQPLDRYPPRRDNLLLRHPGVLARKLATLPAFIRTTRRANRPNYRDAANMANKFEFFSLNPQVLSSMVKAAKSLSVTLNDLFLALLMKAVELLTPDRTREPRRRGVCLGCIVNARKDLGMNGGRVFGLFLGSFIVHHPVPPGSKLEELARDIGRQTLRIKKHRLYLGAAVELAFGRFVASLFSVARRKKLFQKHYPLWGGLSNMDLNPLWPQEREDRAVDYFRAVSTGPITPLVMSITTIGRVANIGLTYRSTVFSAPDIDRIKSCFLDLPGLLAANP
jgi:NRPS condensation-like uncharacterized protein